MAAEPSATSAQWWSGLKAQHVISLPRLAFLVWIAGLGASPIDVSARVSEVPGARPLQSQGERESALDAAREYLRHLYAVYLAVRGCTEAGRPEYLPTVSLDDARRTMRAVDVAAKEVGIDVDRIWSEIAPVGTVTAETLKTDTPGHLEHCHQIGGIFRLDLSNLQTILKALGSGRSLIEKDF